MKKKILLSVFAIVLILFSTGQVSAGDCTASTTISGVTFSCSGTKKCSSKAGKWIKCDGNKIRVSVQE